MPLFGRAPAFAGVREMRHSYQLDAYVGATLKSKSAADTGDLCPALSIEKIATPCPGPAFVRGEKSISRSTPRSLNGATSLPRPVVESPSTSSINAVVFGAD